MKAPTKFYSKIAEKYPCCQREYPCCQSSPYLMPNSFFEIFMPFPGEAKTPKSTESAGKQLLTAHGILECSQTCAASCFCWWLPLSHNEHGCWQKKSCWYDWYVYIYIYKWTELTCQLDCLLVTKTWISQLCPVWFFNALKTKLVNPPIFGVKNRIQTWLGNPRTKWWIFHCHVRLPDGTNIKHHYVPC